MSTSGMHRRPFEGRHLVLNAFTREIFSECVIFCMAMKICSDSNYLGTEILSFFLHRMAWIIF